MNVYLGLDTSCYTTSAALVDERGGIVADVRKPLEVAHGARGMRQSDMVFKHNDALPALVEGMMRGLRAQDKHARVAGVAASTRPRGVEGSYMPTFTVGQGYALTIASVLGLRFHAATHQWGHIKAGLHGASLGGKFYALHISGGTTELLRVDGDAIALISGTLDISAGQLVDRVGVMLEMQFPAGPRLETLASGADEAAKAMVEKSAIRPVIKDGHCSLSGAEAQLKRWHEQDGMDAARIALHVYHVIASTLAVMMKGARVTGDVLFVGGVASSALLRSLLNEKYLPGCAVTPHYAPAALSGDNAVGVALIAREMEMVI